MKIIGLLSFQSSPVQWSRMVPVVPSWGRPAAPARPQLSSQPGMLWEREGQSTEQPGAWRPTTTTTTSNNRDSHQQPSLHHSSLQSLTVHLLSSSLPAAMVCSLYSQVSGQFIMKYFLQNVLPHTQSFMQGQTEYGPVEQGSGKKSRVYTLLYILQYYMDYVSMYFVNYVCSYPCFIMIIYRDNI